MTASFPALEPLEIATGLAVGGPVSPQLPPLASRGAAHRPREALYAALVPALAKAPCVVSFSGGRDSSAILAMACHVARAEGLELPVPMTLRFPSSRSHEDEWQTSVIDHLGLQSWERQDLTDELNVLGPAATSILTGFGPYLPSNLHFFSPVMEAAAGGSMLTGVGGDEIFSRWSTKRDVVRRARCAPTRRNLLDLALAFSPPVARRAILRWHRPIRMRWLRPAAADELTRRWALRQSVHQRTYQDGLDAFVGSRGQELQEQCLATAGQASDVLVLNPFLDRGFLSSVARHLPPSGFTSRTAAMSGLVGDLLPAASVHRSTKAVFTEVLWGAACRDFALGWEGAGVDTDLVDPDVLKEIWRAPMPPWRSMTLLQQAWLFEWRSKRFPSAQPTHRSPVRAPPTSGAC